MAGQCPDCGNAPPNCPTCWAADQREITQLRRRLAVIEHDAPIGAGALGLVREALETCEEETTLDAARRVVQERDQLTTKLTTARWMLCDVCGRDFWATRLDMPQLSVCHEGDLCTYVGCKGRYYLKGI